MVYHYIISIQMVWIIIILVFTIVSLAGQMSLLLDFKIIKYAILVNTPKENIPNNLNNFKLSEYFIT